MPAQIQKLFTKLLKWRYKNISNKTFTHILAVVVGLLAGLASVTLKNLTYYIQSSLEGGIVFSSNQLYFILPIIGLALVFLYVKFVHKEKLEHAKKRVGHEKLILDFENKQGKLLISGMVLDLGGIAKGYTADRMLEILKSNKITRVLIDAGGDLLAGDAPRGKRGWKIDIGGRKHPDLPSIILSNKAVATSGDMEQSITFNGKTYSHLIHPKSGIGLTTQSQVSVIAPTCMHADSLASATLVLGKAKGIKFLKSKPLVKGYHVQKISDNVILTKTHD